MTSAPGWSTREDQGGAERHKWSRSAARTCPFVRIVAELSPLLVLRWGSQGGRAKRPTQEGANVPALPPTQALSGLAVCARAGRRSREPPGGGLLLADDSGCSSMVSVNGSHHLLICGVDTTARSIGRKESGARFRRDHPVRRPCRPQCMDAARASCAPSARPALYVPAGQPVGCASASRVACQWRCCTKLVG